MGLTVLKMASLVSTPNCMKHLKDSLPLFLLIIIIFLRGVGVGERRSTNVVVFGADVCLKVSDQAGFQLAETAPLTAGFVQIAPAIQEKTGSKLKKMMK